jgi:hypothetical protein
MTGLPSNLHATTGITEAQREAFIARRVDLTPELCPATRWHMISAPTPCATLMSFGTTSTSAGPEIICRDGICTELRRRPTAQS